MTLGIDKRTGAPVRILAYVDGHYIVSALRGDTRYRLAMHDVIGLGSTLHAAT